MDSRNNPVSTNSGLAKHPAKLLNFAIVAFCGMEDLSHDDCDLRENWPDADRLETRK